MQSKDLYNNIVQSIVKFSLDFMSSEGIPATSYVDWDAHSQISELPKADVVLGPAGVGMSHESKYIVVIFSIGVATENDPHLFKLRDLMSKLYGKLEPESRITIYEHSTAQPATWMVTAAPVAITPVSKAESRSLQFIEVRALIDPGATSSLR